jgi:tRNA dimethylallyltransferase
MHLIVICGPTATGKTALACDLAHRLGTELISADSRQVYRGLDLGTGKDLREYRKFDPPVRYHLIDIVEPEKGYSLFEYQRDCHALLDAKAREGGTASGVLVMAGGTGMYVEAVLRRYRIANVPENPGLRNILMERTREELEAELAAKDPELASRTDLSSRKRIVRALEVWEASRSGPVEYSRLPETDFTFSVFATRMDRTRLRARIDARLEARLGEGMVEEVEALLQRGVTPERMAVLGMEYREITEHLIGKRSRDEMADRLRHEIHLLAKRQETYFRGMERRGVPMTWLDEGRDASAIESAWNALQAGHG